MPVPVPARPCLDAWPEVEDEEGRDGVVDASLNNSPPDHVVDPLGEVGVRPARERVGGTGRRGGEEVRAHVPPHLLAEVRVHAASDEREVVAGIDAVLGVR